MTQRALIVAVEAVEPQIAVKVRQAVGACGRGTLALALGGALWLGAAVLVPASASAQILTTYRVGLDLGNNPSTGCPFDLGSIPPGSLSGFERELTVVVDSATSPPSVVSADVASCSGGSFIDPLPVAGFAWELEPGPLGSDALVGAIPAEFLDGAGMVRLAFHSASASGSEDALFTTDGSADGLAIVTAFLIAIPTLSPAGLVALLVVVGGAGIWIVRRRRSLARTVAVCGVVVICAGAAARSVAQYLAQSAVDLPGDSTPFDSRTEILAASIPSASTSSGGGLELRLAVESIDILDGSLRSVGVGTYVTSDAGTGELSSTLPLPNVAPAHFQIVTDSGSFYLQTIADGRYARVLPPDISGKSFVVADAVDFASATGLVFFATDSGSGYLRLFIVIDGPAAATVGQVQVDADTDRLHVVNVDVLDAALDVNHHFDLGN